MTMLTHDPPHLGILKRADIFRQSQLSLDLNWSRLPLPRGYPLHRHEFSELVIVLAGSGLHTTPTESFSIRRGDVFMLQGDEAHGYQETHELEMANLLFFPGELRLPWGELSALPGFHVLFTIEPHIRRQESLKSRLCLDTASLKQVTAWLTELDRELTEQQPGWTVQALSYFLLILTHLSRCAGQDARQEPLPVLKIGSVLSLMEQRYAEPLTLEQLAREGHLSERSLHRSFHQALGCSPMEYLTRIRLQRAQELLKRSGATVTEVAHSVGFSDSSYFSRKFRQAVGVSPRDWQRRRT